VKHKSSIHAYLTAPIAIDSNHSLQLILAVSKNFPRNSIIKICQRVLILDNCRSSNNVKAFKQHVTWSTVVAPTMAIKRWLFVTPLKTFFSSGLRALNSLKIWHKWHSSYGKTTLWCCLIDLPGC